MNNVPESAPREQSLLHQVRKPSPARHLDVEAVPKLHWPVTGGAWHAKAIPDPSGFRLLAVPHHPFRLPAEPFC